MSANTARRSADLIRDEYESFMRSSENPGVLTDVEQGKHLLTMIRQRGRNIADVAERDSYAQMARTLGERLYALTGEFYPIRIEAASGETAQAAPSSDGATLIGSTGAVALGHLATDEENGKALQSQKPAQPPPPPPPPPRKADHRALGTFAALLLVILGLGMAGLVVGRVWQDSRSVIPVGNAAGQGGAPTIVVSAAALAVASTRPLGNAQVQPFLISVESGGMPLNRPQTVAVAAPSSEPVTTLLPTGTLVPTADPCPPVPMQGFAAQTPVISIGMLRVYSQADVTSTPLRNLSAGQELWIVEGEDGRTAVKRCDVIWQRVRTADGLLGWVLEAAIEIVPSTMDMPLSAATATVSACVSECVQ